MPHLVTLCPGSSPGLWICGSPQSVLCFTPPLSCSHLLPYLFCHTYPICLCYAAIHVSYHISPCSFLQARLRHSDCQQELGQAQRGPSSCTTSTILQDACQAMSKYCMLASCDVTVCLPRQQKSCLMRRDAAVSLCV